VEYYQILIKSINVFVDIKVKLCSALIKCYDEEIYLLAEKKCVNFFNFIFKYFLDVINPMII